MRHTEKLVVVIQARLASTSADLQVPTIKYVGAERRESSLNPKVATVQRRACGYSNANHFKIVIDLDGRLIRSKLLVASLLLMRDQSHEFFASLRWLSRGCLMLQRQLRLGDPDSVHFVDQAEETAQGPIFLSASYV